MGLVRPHGVSGTHALFSDIPHHSLNGVQTLFRLGIKSLPNWLCKLDAGTPRTAAQRRPTAAIAPDNENPKKLSQHLPYISITFAIFYRPPNNLLFNFPVPWTHSLPPPTRSSRFCPVTRNAASSNLPKDWK
jgi:hypothetical protein